MLNYEAMFYEELEDNRMNCKLCPHNCYINNGHKGICGVRINQDGKLYTLNYGEVSSLAIDPIEKKPLYHYFPGSLILSAGSFGCNLACSFCQNYSIAQEQPVTKHVNPAQLIALAIQTKSKDSIGIAFTYNEPSIWYEYIYHAAIKLKENGLKTVLVTNGYIEKQPLQKIIPYIDAMNIDVKSFESDFYRRNCKARLDPVKATVEYAMDKVHVEITTLIIPGENDSAAEIKSLTGWLASLDPMVPFHLSRYYPAYRMTTPATPKDKLIHACDIARENLSFVYPGNLPGQENNTCCLRCGNILINRNGYTVDIIGLQDGRCKSCGMGIDYIKQ